MCPAFLRRHGQSGLHHSLQAKSVAPSGNSYREILAKALNAAGDPLREYFRKHRELWIPSGLLQRHESMKSIEDSVRMCRELFARALDTHRVLGKCSLLELFNGIILHLDGTLLVSEFVLFT